MTSRPPATGVAIVSAIACAVLGAVVATPAASAGNVYVPQVQSVSSGGNQLTQFAIAANGSLTDLPFAALTTNAKDIAITPDGRFAYVTNDLNGVGNISQFARDASGTMQPLGSVSAGANPLGIVVNPQGTRVYYVDANTPALSWRSIAADGTLGAATSSTLTVTPSFVAMTPSGTSLYVSEVPLRGAAGFLQYDVNLATGAVTAKAPALVAWPDGPTAAPASNGRMTVSPGGTHLYGASTALGKEYALFTIGATGALTNGVRVGPTDTSYGTNVVALAPGGQFLWGPTQATTSAGINQFAVAAAGTLTPLSPAFVSYVGSLATAKDAITNPAGSALYVAQDGNVGDWAIAPAGTLAWRANHPSSVAGTTNAGVAVSPSQAPVASFTVTPGVAGAATTFDASASSDPDGTIARYSWVFGDGATLPNGGPAPSHVYAAAGARTATLTVTDADGTSTARVWTGTQMLRNGGPSAQTTRTFTVAAVPPPPPPPPPLPPPPPPPPPATPTPDKGKSVTIARVNGKVLVKVPGSGRYVDVGQLREIPLGSRIDARRGQVRLTSEVDAKTHKTQSTVFYAGIFDVSQTKGSKPIVVAQLAGGTFAGCSGRTTSRAVIRGVPWIVAQNPLFTFAAKKKARSKRVVRRLWGNGKGDFRTGGRHSSATVRGTWWLVEDRCDGTLTRVRRGRVDVRDIRLKKTIKLRAGKRSLYLAKAP